MKPSVSGVAPLVPLSGPDEQSGMLYYQLRPHETARTKEVAGMRQVIEGKVYNTETATLLHEW